MTDSCPHSLSKTTTSVKILVRHGSPVDFLAGVDCPLKLCGLSVRSMFGSPMQPMWALLDLALDVLPGFSSTNQRLCLKVHPAWCNARSRHLNRLAGEAVHVPRVRLITYAMRIPRPTKTEHRFIQVWCKGSNACKYQKICLRFFGICSLWDCIQYLL